MIDPKGIAVAHVEKDEDGTMVEPEQQPVQFRGRLPIVVNMGRAVEGQAGPVIERANLVHGIEANFTRETTAGTLANEIRNRCETCKFFDLGKIQKSPKAEAMHVEVAGVLVQQGFTSDPLRAIEEARRIGFCNYLGYMAHPHGICVNFKESRFGEAAKASRSKFDAIMSAAMGKFFKRG